jgi:hypothetical protein
MLQKREQYYLTSKIRINSQIVYNTSKLGNIKNLCDSPLYWLALLSLKCDLFDRQCIHHSIKHTVHTA